MKQLACSALLVLSITATAQTDPTKELKQMGDFMKMYQSAGKSFGDSIQAYDAAQYNVPARKAILSTAQQQQKAETDLYTAGYRKCLMKTGSPDRCEPMPKAMLGFMMAEEDIVRLRTFEPLLRFEDGSAHVMGQAQFRNDSIHYLRFTIPMVAERKMPQQGRTIKSQISYDMAVFCREGKPVFIQVFQAGDGFKTPADLELFYFDADGKLIDLEKVSSLSSFLSKSYLPVHPDQEMADLHYNNAQTAIRAALAYKSEHPEAYIRYDE